MSLSRAARLGDSMPDSTRRLHRALLQSLIEQGAIPARDTLAAIAGLSVTDLPERLQELKAADYIALDGEGRVSCLYPFSPVPTPHRVVINGQRRYAMCAIDALGIPAMLNTELSLAGRCAICSAPIALRVRPGAMAAVEPATAMVVARRDEAEPAFAACCPFTVFVCAEDHADQLVHQTSGAVALSPAEALVRAEEIFGGLLADTLPATRPRGRSWHGPHHD